MLKPISEVATQEYHSSKNLKISQEGLERLRRLKFENGLLLEAENNCFEKKVH